MTGIAVRENGGDVNGSRFGISYACGNVPDCGRPGFFTTGFGMGDFPADDPVQVHA